jgi:membrane protease YdiL (CAAX protease family)
MLLQVALQAASFGLAHLHGIPGGPAGMIAAAGFGAIMAVVRLRTGLPAAIAAHFITDLAIFGVAAGTAIYLPNT